MNTKKKSVPAFVRKPEFVTIIILIVMIIVVAALQGNFFAPSSLQNMIISWTPIILLTIGQAMIICPVVMQWHLCSVFLQVL